jgi:ubiquinone/menaquinone biosynthesis C-methylase UbiE
MTPSKTTGPTGEWLDFGIDAPGVRRVFVLVGAAGAVGAGVLTAWHVPGPAWVGYSLRAFSIVIACYGLGMATYMTYGSRIGKLRTRERLLDAIPWSGAEHVLDVGCGRGLMAIGAALRVPDGTVVGIDLWSAADQTDNSPLAARENARRAGVDARVRIDTGDMRALPYPTGSFDVVLSHWVVHNVEAPADRAKAIEEMVRVLRPNGALILADISNQDEYITRLRALGLTDMLVDRGGLESALIGFFSGNTFRPGALIARSAAGTPIGQ